MLLDLVTLSIAALPLAWATHRGLRTHLLLVVCAVCMVLAATLAGLLVAGRVAFEVNDGVASNDTMTLFADVTGLAIVAVVLAVLTLVNWASDRFARTPMPRLRTVSVWVLLLAFIALAMIVVQVLTSWGARYSEYPETIAGIQSFTLAAMALAAAAMLVLAIAPIYALAFRRTVQR